MMKTKKKPTIDWTTVVMTGPPEPIRDETPRDDLDDAHDRVVPLMSSVAMERRGRSSPLKDLLSGASMRARSNGARFTHARICRQLRSGFDVLIYGIGLLAAVCATDHDDRLARVTYVIGDASDRIERRGVM